MKKITMKRYILLLYLKEYIQEEYIREEHIIKEYWRSLIIIALKHTIQYNIIIWFLIEIWNIGKLITFFYFYQDFKLVQTKIKQWMSNQPLQS